MRLRFVQPHPRLKGFINKMWVFESDGRAPVEDMKLIVPNGMVKMTIPYRNGISGSNKDGYRLFRVRQAELKNRIFLIGEIMGKSARDIQEAIANTATVNGKIRLVQQYLIKLLSDSGADPVLDYCIGEIESSKGLLTVRELERRTGYSSRWLYDKFIEKVGLSPKNLSSVIRFTQFYKQWAKDPGADFYKDDIYHFFYDQAHFIKDFKRFTGLSPLKFVRSDNEFGRIFWKG